MERTLRQIKNVLLNTFEKDHGRKIHHCTSLREQKGKDDRMYRKESNDCGFFMNIFNNTLFFCLSTG